METVEEMPKPVLVEPLKRRRRSSNILPNLGNLNPIPDKTSTENGSPPVVAREPDHSLVPKSPKRLMEPQAFFAYWQSIPKPERDAWFIAYVYRKYPICDILQPLTIEELRAIEKRQRKKPESNCGKLQEPFDPARWEAQVYEKWGAGDYQIRLNDQHPSVHDTVTECHVKGLRDWENWPPILKLEEVVLTEEMNGPYLRWARLHGIKFPGDPGTETGPMDPDEEQEQQDMANAATVVDSVLKQSRDLTDRVLEMANRPAAVPVADAASRAQLGGVETVVEASKRGMEIMGNAMRQVTESQVKAQDPDQHLRHVIEMAKLLQPPAAPPNTAANDMLAMMKLQLDQQEKSFTRLIDMQRESHTTTVEMLKSRLDTLEREKAAAPATKGGNEMDILDRMIAYKEKLDTFAETNAPAPAGPAWLAPVLDFAQGSLDKISTGLGHLAALRNAPPPIAPQSPAEIQEPKPVVVPQEDSQVMQRRKWAEMIHPHLVKAMKDQTPGFEFGAALINEAGQASYDGLAGGGYDGVVDFLRSSPPLWKELLTPPLGSGPLEIFVREFLDKPRVMQCLAMLKGEMPAEQPKPHRGPVVS